MKSYGLILPLALALGLMLNSRSVAQTSVNLDLSTRCVGVPPSHVTVSSVAQWMQNPMDLSVQICVSNFYAASSNYLEMTIGGNDLKFYGAGMDTLGNFIPTNYPPVTVAAILRREYPFSIMCPNSGPNGSPLFQWKDFNNPDNFISSVTNGNNASAVDVFLWTNFTAYAQNLFTTNSDPDYAALRQTNLVVEMNRIITAMPLGDTNVFTGVTLGADTISLLAQNPSGQQLVQLYRLLFRDAIGLAANSQADDSGSAQITFSVQTPPQLVIYKNKTAPTYNVLLNGDNSSGGVLNLMNPGIGYYSATNETLEILQDKFGHFSTGDGCDDATKAPGQGNWLRLGPGCNADTNRIAIEWSVSLGRSFDGLAAGQLALHEPGLTSGTYTPYALYYNGSMTNLYAEESLLNTNLPFLTTNLDGSILTNQFVPVLSQNIWSLTNIYTSQSSVLVNNIQNLYQLSGAGRAGAE